MRRATRPTEPAIRSIPLAVTETGIPISLSGAADGGVARGSYIWAMTRKQIYFPRRTRKWPPVSGVTGHEA
jgi:hypothetical protein